MCRTAELRKHLYQRKNSHLFTQEKIDSDSLDEGMKTQERESEREREREREGDEEGFDEEEEETGGTSGGNLRIPI